MLSARALPLLASVTLLLGCRGSGAEAPAAPPSPAKKANSAPASAAVGAQMQDVLFHLDPTVVLHIRHLRGRLLSTEGSEVVDFDDPDHLLMEIDAAEIAIDPGSLTDLLNRYVFTGPKTPIEDVTVTLEDGKLRQRATLRRGPGVPFSMVAEATATADGRVRLHPEEVKAAGLPVKGLMHLLHLTVEELVEVKEIHGVEFEDDDVLLDPQRLLPPPRVQGRVSGVRVERNAFVQIFGGEEVQPRASDSPSPHFMRYRGGTLHFGKLTMRDADMLIYDAGAEDPFRFFLRQYRTQLVAGFSETMPDDGLRVAMPDWDDASRGAVALRQAGR